AERDRLQRTLTTDHGQGLLEDRVEIGDLRNELTLATEVQEFAHDVARASRLLLDQIELLPPRLTGWHLLGEVGRETEHARQRIVDLVGDVRRQLADGGELGRLDQLGLRPLELGHLLLLGLVEPRVLAGDGRRSARIGSRPRSGATRRRCRRRAPAPWLASSSSRSRSAPGSRWRPGSPPGASPCDATAPGSPRAGA